MVLHDYIRSKIKIKRKESKSKFRVEGGQGRRNINHEYLFVSRHFCNETTDLYNLRFHGFILFSDTVSKQKKRLRYKMVLQDSTRAKNRGGHWGTTSAYAFLIIAAFLSSLGTILHENGLGAISNPGYDARQSA